MMDEQSTLTADEILQHFDRRAGSDRAYRYLNWALSVFCWDGALPFAVVTALIITKLLLPRNEAVLAFVAIFGPIGAFSFRFLAGYVRMRSQPSYLLQNLAFVVAICVLFLCETIWAVDHFGKGPKIATLMGLLYMYACYLTLMALALFPLRGCHRGNAAIE